VAPHSIDIGPPTDDAPHHQCTSSSSPEWVGRGRGADLCLDPTCRCSLFEPHGRHLHELAAKGASSFAALATQWLGGQRLGSNPSHSSSGIPNGDSA